MRLGITRWAALLSCVVLGLSTLSACSGGDEAKVDSTAKELEGNVEQSGQIMKEEWAADRAEGEGVVESAGNAYEGVLEEGREKAEEKK